MASDIPTSSKNGRTKTTRVRALDAIRNINASKKETPRSNSYRKNNIRPQRPNIVPIVDTSNCDQLVENTTTITTTDNNKNSFDANQTTQTTQLSEIDNHRKILDHSTLIYCNYNEDKPPYCLLCNDRPNSKINPKDYPSLIAGHAKSNGHRETYRNFIRYSNLWNLPPLMESQSTLLNKFIENVYVYKVVNSIGTVRRKEILDDLNEFLQTMGSGYHLRPVGSSFTGADLEDSDLNLELVYVDEPPADNGNGLNRSSLHGELVNPEAELGKQINHHVLYYDLVPNAITKLHEFRWAIENSRDHERRVNYTIVSSPSEINSKTPRLVMVHAASRVNVEICCNLGSSHSLMKLLKWYLSLDLRARKLSVFMKSWAMITNFNNPMAGSLPPYAMVLLVINFLQRTKPPILPCFHETREKERKLAKDISDLLITNSLKSPSNEASNSVNVKKPSKKHEIKSSGSHESSNHSSTLSESNDSDDEDKGSQDGDQVSVDDEEEDVISDAEFVAFPWSTQNKESVSELLIGFLRYIALDFDYKKYAISIRTLEDVTLAKKKWNTKAIAIEDPTKPFINLGKNIGSMKIFSIFINNLQETYRYFLTPPVHKELNVPPGSIFQDVNSRCTIDEQGLVNYMNDHIDRPPHTDSIDRFRELNDCLKLTIDYKMLERAVELLDSKFNDSIVARLNVFSFRFDDITSMDGFKMVPLFCWVCRGFAHTRKTCPSTIRKSDLLFSVTQEFSHLAKPGFDDIFLFDWNNAKIKPKLAAYNREIVEIISQMISQSTNLDCVLELFGSTVNGLGTMGSDLDICMTLKYNPTGRGLKLTKVLKKVLPALEASPEIISNIVPILSAKVPIIKFKFKKSISDVEREVDLSIYNKCACFNTKLIKTYCDFDNRVAPLCYIVRKMAKGCGVCDAPRGSLSSYAWTLLVIHFLQSGISPPVLPCLQELYEDTKPMYGVAGWNVWFLDDLEYLNNWTKSNTLSITQLYMYFLEYYTKFNFDCHTVTIRKLGLIERHRKKWNGCKMTIEDPFVLTWNLASRVDDRMACFIQNIFPRAHLRLCQALNELKSGRPQGFKGMRKQPQQPSPNHMLRYIFDARFINDYKSAPIRGCHRCGNVGHIVKNCPKLMRQQT